MAELMFLERQCLMSPDREMRAVRMSWYMQAFVHHPAALHHTPGRPRQVIICPHMQVLAEVMVKEPRIPVISNVTGQPFPPAAEIPAALARQLVEPVRWEATLASRVTQVRQASMQACACCIVMQCPAAPASVQLPPCWVVPESPGPCAPHAA